MNHNVYVILIHTKEWMWNIHSSWNASSVTCCSIPTQWAQCARNVLFLLLSLLLRCCLLPLINQQVLIIFSVFRFLSLFIFYEKNYHSMNPNEFLISFYLQKTVKCEWDANVCEFEKYKFKTNEFVCILTGNGRITRILAVNNDNNIFSLNSTLIEIILRKQSIDNRCYFGQFFIIVYMITDWTEDNGTWKEP